MKIVGKNEIKCTLCGNCETICSIYYFKGDNWEKSSIRVEEISADPGVDIRVCNQCGKCVDVCPALALSRNKKGTVILNKKGCIGCFNCVGICPAGAMFWQENLVEPFKCIACSRCTKECPTEAIFMQEV
ncbi:MAG TPA: 4Fe-4S dicluster domain-containing protein [Candidatus Limnocylindrales bacterium]|nr:4Fe-4S dicluster domain-containing protein [Candidatus Limnocylindrales bacterium]